LDTGEVSGLVFIMFGCVLIAVFGGEQALRPPSSSTEYVNLPYFLWMMISFIANACLCRFGFYANRVLLKASVPG
jgi:hypothetical protein